MPAKYTDVCRVGHALDMTSGTSKRCRPCRDAYMRQYRADNPERFTTLQATRVRTSESLTKAVSQAKMLRHIRRYDGIVYLGGLCVDCGFKNHLDAFQFDHILGSPTKRDRKAVLGSYGWERMREELDKCELVCANCHAIRTQSRRES